MSTSRIMPHRHNNRFYNHKGEKLENWFLTSAHLLLQSFYARRFHPPTTLSDWTEPAVIVERSYMPRITWLGHSTFLVQVAHINILTDPIFGSLSVAFPRILPCAVQAEKLPPIDAVIISHNHPDHLDSKAFHTLRNHNPRYLVPHGDKRWFEKRNYKHAREFTWWQSTTITQADNQVTCTFLPAHHWSQRGLFDRNKSLWGSWMIQGAGFTIYFAGDTAYGQHFSNIAEHFSPIDIALMPIGPCEPRAWMQRTHVSAEEAGQAFLDLKAQLFIPMHWGAYHFGTDPLLAPLHRLNNWWKEQQASLLTQQLQLFKVGTSISFAQPPVTASQLPVQL